MRRDQALERVRGYMDARDVRMQRISGYEGDQVGGRLGGRRGTFHRDFYDGYRGNLMEQALEQYTWSNLGWRLGAILGAATERSLPKDDQKEIAALLFDMLAHLQKETIEWHNDNLGNRVPVPADDPDEAGDPE